MLYVFMYQVFPASAVVMFGTCEYSGYLPIYIENEFPPEQAQIIESSVGSTHTANALFTFSGTLPRTQPVASPGSLRSAIEPADDTRIDSFIERSLNVLTEFVGIHAKPGMFPELSNEPATEYVLNHPLLAYIVNFVPSLYI